MTGYKPLFITDVVYALLWTVDLVMEDLHAAAVAVHNIINPFLSLTPLFQKFYTNLSWVRIKKLGWDFVLKHRFVLLTLLDQWNRANSCFYQPVNTNPRHSASGRNQKNRAIHIQDNLLVTDIHKTTLSCKQPAPLEIKGLWLMQAWV